MNVAKIGGITPSSGFLTSTFGTAAGLLNYSDMARSAGGLNTGACDR